MYGRQCTVFYFTILYSHFNTVYLNILSFLDSPIYSGRSKLRSLTVSFFKHHLYLKSETQFEPAFSLITYYGDLPIYQHPTAPFIIFTEGNFTYTDCLSFLK
jgi:hypothetical protein